MKAGQREEDGQNGGFKVGKHRINNMTSISRDVGLHHAEHQAGQKRGNPQAGGKARGKDQRQHGAGGDPMGKDRPAGKLVHRNGDEPANPSGQGEFETGFGKSSALWSFR